MRRLFGNVELLALQLHIDQMRLLLLIRNFLNPFTELNQVCYSHLLRQRHCLYQILVRLVHAERIRSIPLALHVVEPNRVGRPNQSNLLKSELISD